MYNHRGMPTGTNHRPTPRLAQAIARRMSNDIQSQMWEEAPHLYRATQGPNVAEAQAALDNYRFQRDTLKSGRPDAASRSTVNKTAKYIMDTFKDWSDYDSDVPNSYLTDGPASHPNRSY